MNQRRLSRNSGGGTRSFQCSALGRRARHGHPGCVSAEPKGGERFFDFFTFNIRNRNTRRSNYKAAIRSASGIRRNILSV
jgi:hypothetical protein